MNEERRQIANKALAFFSKNVSILPNGKVRFPVYPYGENDFLEKQWVPISRGSFYPKWHRKFTHGGTVTTALCQLVRFVNEQPVLPLSSWEYWCGNSVALAGERGQELINILRHVWPDAKCVLCGEAMTGVDWWTDKKRDGPCCSWSAGCRQKVESMY